jgi:hypothetical protein
MLVLKVGGNEIDDPNRGNSPSAETPVIVHIIHGGGKEIADLS